MAKKRRTKKDKINPKRPTTISWKPSKTEAKKADSEANVKRQLKKGKSRKTSKNNVKKSARFTDKNHSLASVKRDLVKSLLFAVLILASEVMIYLIWD
jgi:hypothetical protein